MSKFQTYLAVDVLTAEEVRNEGGGRQLYRLINDLIYVSDLLGTLVAPAGMVTNFASIPRIVWNILDPEDPCILYGSVIHDMLYGCEGRPPNRAPVSRQEADAMLREAMELCGASAWQRWAVYNALRIGGASAWRISP